VKGIATGALAALALLAAASPARAGHICELVEPGVLEADGDLDEWRDLGALLRGGGGRGGC
jgi:hypothetical protein